MIKITLQSNTTFIFFMALLTTLSAEAKVSSDHGDLPPNSVERTIIENEKEVTPFFRLESVDAFFKPYNDWKT